MNERIKQLAVEAGAVYYTRLGRETNLGELQKFAELVEQDYAKKTIQGLMGDPAFVQAMDEYYENKWSHRFD